MGQHPYWAIRTEQVDLGGGFQPRSITRRGSCVYVGWRDGGISRIEPNTKDQSHHRTDIPSIETISFFPEAEKALLIGDRHGHLWRYEWPTPEKTEGSAERIREAPKGSPTTCLRPANRDKTTWWHGTFKELRLLDISGDRARLEMKTVPLRAAISAESLDKEGSSFLVICKDATVWRLDQDRTPKELNLWYSPETSEAQISDSAFPRVWYERPALVNDIAVQQHSDGTFATAYLGTESGVFVVQRQTMGSTNCPVDNSAFRAFRLHLDGVGAVIRALSVCRTGRGLLLSVNDNAGTTALFFAQSPHHPWRTVNRRSLGVETAQIQLVDPSDCHPAKSGQTDTPQLLMIQALCNDELKRWSFFDSDQAWSWNSLFAGTDESRLETARKGDPLDDHSGYGSAEACRGEWRPDTELAELFEYLAELRGDPVAFHDPDGRPKLDEATRQQGIHALLDFLSNPSDQLATSILKSLLKRRSKSKQGGLRQVQEALHLWTHTLVGVTGRYLAERRASKETRNAAQIGAIRWLRRLGNQISEDFRPREDDQQELLNEEDRRELLCDIDWTVQWIRKWGLEADAFLRERARLCRLARPESSPLLASRLEALLFEGTLFQRGFDEECRRSSQAIPENTPTVFAAHHSTVGTGRTDLHILWEKSGVKSYRITGEEAPLHIEEPPEAIAVPGNPGSCEPASHGAGAAGNGGAHSRRGYQRRLTILGDGRPLWAERQPVDLKKGSAQDHAVGRDESSGTSHELVIRLGADAPMERLSLGERDYLQHFMPVGEEHVAVALGDRQATYQIVVFEIGQTTGPGETVWEKRRRTGTGPGRTDLISAMAYHRDERSLILGFASGAVVSIPVRGKKPSAQGAEANASTRQVGRLSRPIARIVAEKDIIAAGTDDGTVVAWRRLRRKEQGSRNRGPAQQWRIRWVHKDLKESIVGLLPVEASHDLPAALVAVSRKGEVVAYHNGGLVGEGNASAKLSSADTESSVNRREAVKGRRGPATGDRLFRADFGEPIFGAEAAPRTESPGLLTRIVLITARGGLRLIALYYPENTDCRSEKYRQIMRTWVRLLAPTGAGRPGRAQLHSHLRHAETAAATNLMLPRLMVHWIDSQGFRGSGVRGLVEGEEPGNGAELGIPSPYEQWLPRLHRPLARFRLALDELMDPEENRSADGISQLAGLALQRAFSARDVPLFCDVLKVVLKRCNLACLEFAEAAATERDDRLDKLVEVFVGEHGQAGRSLGEGSLLDTLHRISDGCRGLKPEYDEEVHRVMAREFPDGAVLALFVRLGVFSLEEPPGHLAAMLQRLSALRLGLVRRWLAHENPSVVLETLRSSNAAILRSAIDVREKSLDPPPGEILDGELPLAVISAYLDSVSSCASHSLHTNGGVGDALAHEIARSYATSVLARPSALTNILCSRVEDDRFPMDLLKRIHDQIQLVQDEFEILRLAPIHRDMVEEILSWKNPTVTGGPFLKLEKNGTQNATLLNQLREWSSGPPPGEPSGPGEAAIGADNWGFMVASEPVRRICEWIEELKEAMRSAPTTIHAMFADHQAFSLLNEAAEAQEDGAARAGWGRAFAGMDMRAESDYIYRHSMCFWLGSRMMLEELLNEQKKRSVNSTSPSSYRDRISADDLETSYLIRRWCKQSLQNLKKRRRQLSEGQSSDELEPLFDPWASYYERILEGLRREASRFAFGAAARSAIVVDTLDRMKILPKLGDAALELWVWAQALAPKETWSQEDQAATDAGDGPPPDAQHSPGERGTALDFAGGLISQADEMEAIQRQLRWIRRLMHHESEPTKSKEHFERLQGGRPEQEHEYLKSLIDALANAPINGEDTQSG